MERPVTDTIADTGNCEQADTGPTQANQPHDTLRSTVALNDIQNRILAQPEPVADLPIELAFADEL